MVLPQSIDSPAVWRRTVCLHSCLIAACCSVLVVNELPAQNRFATSDSMSGYVHWIHLYDAGNSRIEPGRENLQPYSPEKTCGRCHDFDTISHGWHFNAVREDAIQGRPGQPWIWSDERTGTHLPLSYRGWQGTYDPDELGLTRWQVAAKLGGFLPGGGVGDADSLSEIPPAEGSEEDRSKITGALPVDCMMCHHNRGSGYSPFAWTEQIEMENFAYAPTAAMGLGTVEGRMSRLKNFDPSAEDAQGKLPKLTYEDSRFRADGTVFFDLVRKPKNDACYYCHTNESTDVAQGQRWLHDEDVHVRAGIACVDCHRNSLDHHIVRGFEGEVHPAGSMVASLSCQGCHMGGEQANELSASELSASQLSASGRLGAPRPAHRGLPPLHFEKMTCTACHSGPLPTAEATRQFNSIAHHLGEHVKRTGDEFPGIVGGVLLRVAAGEALEDSPGESESHKKYTPHRMMWPSYWGVIQNGKVQVLNPEVVYELVRRPLKTKEFTEDLADVGRQMNLTKKKELLGDDRARVKPEEWTEDEQAKIAAAEAELRDEQINERMSGALLALEEAFPDAQAVYVSGGAGFVRAGERIELADPELLDVAAEPYAWPLAHNVRPAQQSLGSTGCLECHSDGALIFQTEIEPVGLLPDQPTQAVKAHVLQEADMDRLWSWNQMFAGRSMFKIAGLVALGLTCLITVCAMAVNLGAFGRRSP